MSEFVRGATDDQLALAICFGAVFASGLIMYFSQHVGRLAGRLRLHHPRVVESGAAQPEQPIRQHPAVTGVARDRAA
jgi:hypothetical protein